MRFILVIWILVGPTPSKVDLSASPPWLVISFDDTESITVHEVPIDEVEDWLAKKRKGGCLTDPKIYAGLYFLNKYNTSITGSIS